ncbi:hypothetical protein DOY81_012354 [Sarcophaga bullata]|nr:hypothetical protein DOY81_012354 [Sarcophaga bullata]
MSHLVTEFTRVTGYTRGPRQDVVMSLIQPIRVQNLVLYPGQEYGLYEQQNQQYYNGNRPFNNYNNNNSNNNHNNFLSSLFKQFINNNNNNIDNNPSEQQQQQHEQPPIQTANNNLLNFIPTNAEGDVRTFSFRPLIDSIFEIPISTLRAVNNLVGRLTGSYQQPASTQQPQQHQLFPQQHQQPPPKYSVSYPSYAQPAPSYYGMQRSADATHPPKTQFEMLNRLRQQTTEKVAESPTAATSTNTDASKPMMAFK